MTTFTAGPLIPLEDLGSSSFGVVVVEDGRGRRFVLKKDGTHNWGLWEQVGAGLVSHIVPIPGGKDEGDASLLILDDLIIVYLAARIGDNARPAQFCEVTAPGVRRQPNMAHVAAIYKEIRTSVAALNARIDAVERLLGSVGEAALEGRVVRLEGKVKEAGAVLGE